MNQAMSTLLQASSGGGHWLEWMDSGSLIMLLVFSIPIVAIVAHYWHQTIKTRAEIELKRQMIEQGMSADEIERVLSAHSPK